MKTKLYLFLLFFSFTWAGNAQELSEDQHATLTLKATYVKQVPSLAELISKGDFQPAVPINKEVNPKKRGANKAVPGKGLPLGNDPLMDLNPNSSNKINGREPIIVWETASANVTPTDPTGAVGPNHYVNAWNSAFRIWDKNGNPLTDAASLGNIFPGETLGDPIVIYDRYADRFIVTEFSNTPNGFLVAVCQGSDPVNDGWYTYRFNTGSFPDYPKYSVWSDGYYITANKDQATPTTSEVVFALERDKMLVGDVDAGFVGFPLPGITTSGFYSPIGFNANGEELPPAGNSPIVYMQDDAWTGVEVDHLKIWNINVDWETPANSTISSPQELPTAAFDGLFDGGSFSNLPQGGGPDLDALQATIMQMAQYRRFGGYSSVVFNFVVDLTGSDDYAGIRWYELRQDSDGDPWYIHQEGTYVQPDGHSAYCGSIGMDGLGNIGMGYTVVSTIQVPSIRYTGRMASDPSGTMTIAEEIIEAGTGWDPSTRYGDYAQLTIDPANDRTFWHTGEYFDGGRKNVVGAFKFAPNFANDIGVVDISSPNTGTLSDNETVTVTVRNLGVEDATGFSVSYAVDGGTVITESVTGTIASGEDVEHTFSVGADMSVTGQVYTIWAASNYDSDMDLTNDTTYKNATNLFPDDIGVAAVLSPLSSDNLTESESITINIENYGGEAQSDFEASYVLDGGDPVTETVAGPLGVGNTINYTFATAGDFSAIGEHEIMTYTSLAGDNDNLNDTAFATVVKNLCQPDLNCNVGDGIQYFELETIVNPSGCGDGGFEDYTNLSTNLVLGSINGLTITTGYGNQFVRVWIDYNDNFTFELDELVVDNYEIADGQGAGTFTETMDLIVPGTAIPGEHRMRAKTNWNAEVPDDACEETAYGETEEYTVVLGAVLDLDVGVTEILQPNSGTLGATESIVVTVFNFGINEVSDVPVYYQINGGIEVMETIPGPIASSAGVEYTFTSTVDLSAYGTYTVLVSTDLDGDENPVNNSLSKEVTNYPPNDIGISAVVSPVSSDNLTETEAITVSIENYGGEPQTDFEVSFVLDGADPVTETVAGPLNFGSVIDYTFTATGNFSSIGEYELMTYTSLADDFDNSNDTAFATVVKNLCQPDLNCTVGDGIQYFELETIVNPSGCGEGGYEDYTNLSTNLVLGSVNGLTITTGYGNQFVRVWIDYNDNDIFELNELVVDNYEIADGEGAGTFTETMDLVVPGTATPGEHRMRAKTNFANGVPDDACEETTFGETEDYTVVLGAVLDLDVGVTEILQPNDGTLSAAESIVVTFFNFGINEVSNVPVYYQVNGGAEVVETIPGPIASSMGVEYTFTTTADLSVYGTYTLFVSTDLDGDANPENNASTKEVTNFPPNDLGVVAIISPSTGESLSDAEPITVTIENFGGEEQTDFDVTFSLDGAAITEVFSETIAPFSTMEYTFIATADVSAFATYEAVAYTSVNEDWDASNDTTYSTFTNSFCSPTSNCTAGDGLQWFQLGSIDNVSGCEENGYGDFTALSTVLDTGSSNELTMTTGYGNQFVRVWIDYNDNFSFEMDELVVDNAEMADGQGGGTYTETHSMVVPGNATPGEHIMRAKTNWNNPVPDDACESTTFGETEDYTVVINDIVGIVEQSILRGDLTVAYLAGDQYQIIFTSPEINERLILTIHDSNGRKVVQNWVSPSNGRFQYDLDMSYASPGVYLVRIGDDKYGKVKQFVVK